MFRKKVYGESRIENCPFCGKVASLENNQGVPVCIDHKNNELASMKCACGEFLDIMKGKWGPFFVCINCGNISFKKGLDMNPPPKNNTTKQDNNNNNKIKAKQTYKTIEKTKDNITISSDELDFYY